MVMNDTLSNAMSNIMNASKIGQDHCLIRPFSKIIKDILEIMKDAHYIGDYEILDPSRGSVCKINLIGSINKCGVIKPRFSVKVDDFEKFEKRYLPAKDFGFLIISTSQGIMTHIQAKEKGIGGRLLAYVY